jgi:Flp pilus assembly protein TadB
MESDKPSRAGFVGWANRLDERVGAVRKLDTHVPMRAGDLWREMVRWPVLPGSIAALVAFVVLLATLPTGSSVLGLVATQPVMLWARSRVRRRRIDEMRAELASGT